MIAKLPFRRQEGALGRVQKKRGADRRSGGIELEIFHGVVSITKGLVALDKSRGFHVKKKEKINLPEEGGIVRADVQVFLRSSLIKSVKTKLESYLFGFWRKRRVRSGYCYKVYGLHDFLGLSILGKI